MEDAILKAIEGGYDKRLTETPVVKPNNPLEANMTKLMTDMFRRDTLYPKLCHDPKFWECLGIGLGNKPVMHCDHYNPRYDEPGERGCNAEQCPYAGYRDPHGMYTECHEAIWNGDTYAGFFTKLIQKK